jgi:hypothetical protein
MLPFKVVVMHRKRAPHRRDGEGIARRRRPVLWRFALPES